MDIIIFMDVDSGFMYIYMYKKLFFTILCLHLRAVIKSLTVLAGETEAQLSKISACQSCCKACRIVGGGSEA